MQALPSLAAFAAAGQHPPRVAPLLVPRAPAAAAGGEISGAGLEAGTSAAAQTPEAGESAQPSDPQASGTPAEVQAQLVQFLAAIGPPLVGFLQRGDDGREFAGWLVEGYGMATFLQLQGLGKETLMLALQSYPPLWEPLQAFAPRLDGFLGAFLQGPPPAEDVGDEPAAAGQEKTSPSGSDLPAAA